MKHQFQKRMLAATILTAIADYLKSTIDKPEPTAHHVPEITPQNTNTYTPHPHRRDPVITPDQMSSIEQNLFTSYPAFDPSKNPGPNDPEYIQELARKNAIMQEFLKVTKSTEEATYKHDLSAERVSVVGGESQVGLPASGKSTAHYGHQRGEVNINGVYAGFIIQLNNLIVKINSKNTTPGQVKYLRKLVKEAASYLSDSRVLEQYRYQLAAYTAYRFTTSPDKLTYDELNKLFTNHDQRRVVLYVSDNKVFLGTYYYDTELNRFYIMQDNEPCYVTDRRHLLGISSKVYVDELDSVVQISPN